MTVGFFADAHLETTFGVLIIQVIVSNCTVFRKKIVKNIIEGATKKLNIIILLYHYYTHSYYRMTFQIPLILFCIINNVLYSHKYF